MTQLPKDVTVTSVHSCDVSEDGRTICVWLDLSDDTSAFFQFTPGKAPGEAVSLSLHA